MEQESLKSMSVKELKQRLRELRVDFTSCSEKDDLVALLQRAEAEQTSGASLTLVPEPPSMPTASAPPTAAAPGHAGAAAASKQARAEMRRPAADDPLIQEVGSSLNEGDMDTGADVTEIRNLARGGQLGPGKLLFRGHAFWQELLPEHVTTPGLEFHVALDTGLNLARSPSDHRERHPRALPEEDPAYVAAAHCVPDSEPSREDEAEVEKAVRAASSWGNRSRLRRLLVSCFVPARCCHSALCEAAQRGHEAVVSELLTAGVPPSAKDAGKSALHFACEQGHEGVATQLLNAKADLRSVDGSGRTPCDLAREQDLGMLAKRLEKQFT